MLTPKQKAIVTAYKRCFATEDGLEVLKDLKRWTILNRPGILAGQPIDKDRLLFDEAQRMLILYILSKVEANLDETPTEAETQETQRW